MTPAAPPWAVEVVNRFRKLEWESNSLASTLSRRGLLSEGEMNEIRAAVAAQILKSAGNPSIPRT